MFQSDLHLLKSAEGMCGDSSLQSSVSSLDTCRDGLHSLTLILWQNKKKKNNNTDSLFLWTLGNCFGPWVKRKHCFQVVDISKGCIKCTVAQAAALQQQQSSLGGLASQSVPGVLEPCSPSLMTSAVRGGKQHQGAEVTSFLLWQQDEPSAVVYSHIPGHRSYPHPLLRPLFFYIDIFKIGQIY